MGTTGIVLVGYFVVLVALSALRAVEVKSRLVQQLRVFFPSWRFFEDLGEVPVLWARIGGDGSGTNDGEDLGPWQRSLPTAAPRWWTLFVNPEANLILAYGSLLEQLVSDLAAGPEGGADDLEETVSYQLTRNLVVHRLRESGRARPGQRYQFKVVSVLQGAPTDSGDDVVVSPIYQA